MRPIAFLILLGGCSAVGLDEFERCDEFGTTPQEQANACADALNAEFDLPASCRAFQCVEGLCVRNDVESCDGLDNDCDGDVDENVFEPSEYRGVGFEDSATSLSVASNGAEANAFWSESVGQAYESAAGAALRPELSEKTALVYRTNMTRTDAALVDGCWQPTFNVFESPPEVEATRTTCNYRAIDTARSATQTLALSVDTSFSGEVLRVGRIDGAGGFRQVGPLTRSNAFLGLGLTEDGRFSAANPRECQRALDAAGTSAPAVACESTAQCPGGECICGSCLSPEDAAVALRCGFASFGFDARDSADGATLGLVAAVSGSFVDAGCRTPDLSSTPEDDSLRDVALFGVRQEPRLDVDLLNASDEARPLILAPQTTGVSKPAVLALGEAFVVAYPGPEQTLALHLLTGDMPAAAVHSECEALAGDTQACADAAIPVCGDTLCGSDIGVCVSGTPTCEAGISLCLGVRNPDVLEGCDNDLDDDCDGRIDESECSAARETMARSEECNGVDDDFDGTIDEDAMGMLESEAPLTNPELAPLVASVGDVCGESEGACETGTVECRGGHLLCVGGRLPYRDTTNNFRDICGSGLDDDCDGITAAACDMCTMSTAEDCNGRDDDCDGRIDEDAAAARLPTRARQSSVIRQCIATPPLGEISGDRGAGFDMPFNDVVLSAGSESDEGLRVGMAYREFLDDGRTRIAFRILTFHNDCSCVGGGSCDSTSCRRVLTPTALRASGGATILSDEGGNGAPALAYVEHGFRSDATGGWHVLWTHDDGSRRSLLGRRVAEETGEPVDDSPFAASGEGEALGPQAFADEMGASYAFIYEEERQIVTARLSCAP